MKKFGLVGFPLTHSFSRKHFTEKFEKEGITDCVYSNYEMETANALPLLVRDNPDIVGLNVTIPHKQNVLMYLSELDDSAQKVGAVNVIKVSRGEMIGYNSDYYGFKQSLANFLPEKFQSGIKALVLGTGGASKAVLAALADMNISYQVVSRTPKGKTISYADLNAEIISGVNIIINSTPLGTFPNIDACPDIPYELLTEEHYLFDLVYNPAETLFMKKGLEKGAKVKNGLEMLQLQAEKSWEIWNS